MSFNKPDWRIAVFSVGFLILFLNLGVWQLDRAKEKTAMLAAAKVQAEAPGVEIERGVIVGTGEPIRAEGRFVEAPVFYLDNRVLDGRVGYEVLQLFALKDEFYLLVNRGFVPGGVTRQQLPDLPTFYGGRQSLRGHAYLTELVEPTQNLSEGEPRVIQVAKPDSLSKVLNLALFSYVVRLDEAHPDALPRYWPVTTMSPDRHQGYAVTWFVMALAIVMAFLSTVVRKNSKEDS